MMADVLVELVYPIAMASMGTREAVQQTEAVGAGFGPVRP